MICFREIGIWRAGNLQPDRALLWLIFIVVVVARIDKKHRKYDKVCAIKVIKHDRYIGWVWVISINKDKSRLRRALFANKFETRFGVNSVIFSGSANPTSNLLQLTSPGPWCRKSPKFLIYSYLDRNNILGFSILFLNLANKRYLNAHKSSLGRIDAARDFIVLPRNIFLPFTQVANCVCVPPKIPPKGDYLF